MRGYGIAFILMIMSPGITGFIACFIFPILSPFWVLSTLNPGEPEYRTEKKKIMNMETGRIIMARPIFFLVSGISENAVNLFSGPVVFKIRNP